MVLDVEILVKRRGKLVFHRQVVLEGRNVFERTGNGIVEIGVEGRLDGRRGFGIAGVGMTEAAARRIAKIVSGEAGKTALRVSVEGGGCSGFSYKFDLVDTRNDDDVAIEKDGATVLIDDLSLVYMGGSVIDFVDDLMGQSFQIRNPNAVASCGCGTSFSV